MLILGIETSCDETSAAIVSDTRQIKSNTLLTSATQHTMYGGVVPEIAARAHLNQLNFVIKSAFKESGTNWNHINAVAATGGPGLVGGIIIGITVAKTISLSRKIPFIAVNHLAGHALTARLTDNISFPYLLLLISGGHCQMVIVHSAIKYEILGETLDDALGETFDKFAHMLELPYPGGPNIELWAQKGSDTRFTFPRPLLYKKDKELLCSFSLSGLKTALKQQIKEMKIISSQDRSDLCASFQKTIGDILINRSKHAFEKCAEKQVPITTFVVSGGVAANQYLRQRLQKMALEKNIRFVAPSPPLCTDNAAMIAWAGIEKMNLGLQDSFSFSPKPRWPLQNYYEDSI